jgi:hypothetical protein
VVYQAARGSVKKSIIVLSCVFTCLLAHDAFAAFKFKRFPHCPDGLVSAKTCECHASNSRHWHFCHAGQYCHTFDGTCSK